MESLSPNIFAPDITATINFYKLLGFEVTMTVPEQGPDFVWVMMAKGNVTFMFQTMESLADELPQISRAGGASMLLYISVKEISNFFEQVKDKVTVLKSLETTFYGATEFSVLDPNNYVLTFAEHQPHDNV